MGRFSCEETYILLYKYKTSLPEHTLKLIFYCIGFPYITYCVYCYYDFLRVSDIRMIERKYVRCGRIILNDNLSSKEEILKKLKWQQFSDLVYNFKVKMLKSVSNGSFAPILSTYLSKPQHRHQTRFNQSSYNIPSSSKTIGSKCFSYWAPRILNEPLWRYLVRFSHTIFHCIQSQSEWHPSHIGRQVLLMNCFDTTFLTFWFC